jgi:hypothetical protein
MKADSNASDCSSPCATRRRRLADLMYGHEGRFMCSLSGPFDPEKYIDAPPIQICEMKCGCWIVADGNNRVGLILRKNPEATIANIPDQLIALLPFGEWDSGLLEWANPCPKSFREAMKKQARRVAAPRNSIYCTIERDEDKNFLAYNFIAKKQQLISATAETVDEAKRLLEEMLRVELGRENLSLAWQERGPLEDHQCRPGINTGASS